MNMEISTKELHRKIMESFDKSLPSDNLNFEFVVEELPARYENDIIQLLPYVMQEALSFVEDKHTKKLQILETVIRIFNGFSDCSSMQAIASKLREQVTPSQRDCIGLWFLFLKDLNAINYVNDDLDGCVRFWN